MLEEVRNPWRSLASSWKQKSGTEFNEKNHYWSDLQREFYEKTSKTQGLLVGLAQYNSIDLNYFKMKFRFYFSWCKR